MTVTALVTEPTAPLTPDADFWRSLDEDTQYVPDDLPEPQKRRHGFYELKQRNPNLYKQLRGHINQCFDKYDWCYLIPEINAKPRASTKETLNFWLDRDTPKHVRKAQSEFVKKLRTLSMRTIEDHCSGDRTIYYTSSPRKHWAVLLLDIDDKEGLAGREDVQGVYGYLNNLFPGFYHQVSTFGKGYHGFLFVHFPDHSHKQFREIVGQLEDVLQTKIHGQFRSTFEIKGNPGLLRKNGTYETCGMPAKFPRLGTDEQWGDYLACPAFTVPHLLDVIQRLTTQPEPIEPLVAEQQQASSSPLLSDIDMHTEVQGVCISISERKEKKQQLSERPEKRMNRCGWDLSKRLKRAANEKELWEEYHDLDLHTGPDKDGNRRKCCEHTAKWLLDNFRPELCGTGRFKLENYVTLINDHVTDEHRKMVRQKNRSKYTSEHIAAVLYTIEQGALTPHEQDHYQFTVPNNSILATMTTLGITFEGTDTAKRNTLSAMKQVLVESGLAELLDPTWSNFKHIGKKYGLGPKHPRHHEYLQFKMSINQKDDDPEIIMLTKGHT